MLRSSWRKPKQGMKNRLISLKREIQFEIGDLVMLNIHNFKMPEALAVCFIPKYARPYRVMHKPHLDVYTLLLPTTFMAHLRSMCLS
jgi:hypothetical protein